MLASSGSGSRRSRTRGAGVFVGEQHPHPEPPEKVFYKTRVCEKFEAGMCAHEDGCTFAHGQAELRPPPPPSGAEVPNTGYYGKVCFEFRDRGTCHYGDRCTYAHASAAEVAEMRHPGGPRSVEHALRNAAPFARAAFSQGPSGGAPRSSSSYAPAAARAFPSPPAAAVGEDGRKLSRLELLSRKKMSGIYGDWPEEH